MTHTAKGTCQIRMQPEETTSPQLGRMSFSKIWEGDLSGTGTGELLSVGDPKSGTAAYTVLEVFEGELAGRRGSFAFHQYGTMHAGQTTLRYEMVPASGTGELAGISGTLHLDIASGVHQYTLSYDLSE
ncbi:hypothetical protein GCM10017783_19800 [Deinococcus piscis]|uniref:DUF3224 domain-containing protein n=1 Tax=Deinococcus piscis TaxID=394230 RepID=A0ABQ3KEM4_9DEIO|nr:DUF3224 domain-containing protein [Deinococcus piscis]GHG07282.1 hypothetical protein GCM10017783_19800 [Deinococcus piscis]